MDMIEQILSNESFISFVSKLIDDRIEAKNCKNFIVSNKNSFIVPENDIESSPMNENLSTQVDERISKIQKMEKFKQKSKSQSQGNEIKSYMQPSNKNENKQLNEDEGQSQYENRILQNICKNKYFQELNIEKYQNFMTQQSNYSQNNKFIDQLEFSTNIDQNCKEISQSFQNNFDVIDNQRDQANPHETLQTVQNQDFENKCSELPFNFDQQKVAKHNNRTLSEPQLQLRKQKIISQISDVLIGISQTKLEDSFCAAINEIQGHINSIQKRISILEITFVNASYKDQVNEQNKVLIDNSSVNFEESSKQYQKCEHDNFLSEKTSQIFLQLNEIKESMEEKIINVWKTVGFINLKIEDLEVNLHDLEDIVKPKNQKQGLFSRKLFGF
ncbi:hypothetical protein TTHERM_00035150 (macronuclear) [Tetrahymena thermophila SB210]|uniref:Uncharacterized protein n=1 Tax=Tetrahymena thermophila (strain SB210) TaxID=312017 RepID=Q22MK5_TETTS|nr:hypothetical protein TTHERM_00035150 [Tetrahymena thermophila SB210]EAR86475.2 hypothetical protein TTHERM_00035150 [Tetrahymena thermophila SB210]|eukprot:XP_977015.2 hypothetical protein TTHERM_00035150 [Tetrahymena thermophila SB210]